MDCYQQPNGPKEKPMSSFRHFIKHLWGIKKKRSKQNKPWLNEKVGLDINC